MAEENLLNLFPNGNHETSPSTGNELLYFTAESDILNVSNDSVNQCLLKTQNENFNSSALSNDSFTFAEKSGDSNCNPVENFDLSITEAFAKMVVSNNSLNDVTMKTMSCSEPPDMSDETFKEELVQQPAAELVFEETKNLIQGESPNVNISTYIGKDEKQNPKSELLPEVEENISLTQVNTVDQAIEKNDDKGNISPLVDDICPNIEESSELLTQMESPHGSSAFVEKTASPNFSGSMLSEQALSFMAGGDSSNEISSIIPDELKVSHNVSNNESTVALSEDVENYPTSKIDLSSQSTNVVSNIVPENDDNIFKVPAIPVKAIENKVISPGNALSNDNAGESFPVSNIREVFGFQANDEISPKNLLADPSGLPNYRNDLFGTSEPSKLSEAEVSSTGLPEPRVFTDFREERNDIEENIFKVPEPPKDEEDEEFTDAVQFFKDPSSFQYLENIQTSLSNDSIPRSSLYVAFDPLHSKRASVSQIQNNPLGKLIPESEVSADISTPVKKHLVDATLRESLGVLISFDSPKPSAKVVPEENDPSVQAVVAKQYSEEELQQILKIHELTMQDTYLKKHRELEQEMAKAEEKNRDTIQKLSSLALLFRNSMEDFLGVIKTHQIRNEELTSKADELEKENEKLKDDLKTAGEDLQSVESTFSDFHKRYEQCKGMLKTYKENEEQLKAKLSEQEQKYNILQEQSHEALEKANMEATVAKKSSEGQVTVLKAQLKKAELKISSLESDLSQVKIENSKLGGICDDLMAKVSEG